jgi:hypothetical protein
MIDTDVLDLRERRRPVPGRRLVTMEAAVHIMAVMDLKLWRPWGRAPRPQLLWLWSWLCTMDLMMVETMVSVRLHGHRTIITNIELYY